MGGCVLGFSMAFGAGDGFFIAGGVSTFLVGSGLSLGGTSTKSMGK
ncbi:MAG: hypothetical protein ACREQO_01845 [Candidatus Binatia bacterium]